MDARDYFTLDKSAPVLSLGKLIINIKTGDILGELILNVQESTLSDVCKNIGPIVQNEYFIVDEKGQIVSSVDKSMLMTTINDPLLRKKILSADGMVEILQVNGIRTLITSMPIPGTTMKLVNRIPP